MSGFAVVFGLIAFALLGLAHFIAGFSTAICWIFAVAFWGSAIIFAGSAVLGVVGGLFCGDFEAFSRFISFSFYVFAIGVCIAVCVFLCAVVVDFTRSIAHFANLTDEVGIEFSHLFFPWTRP